MLGRLPSSQIQWLPPGLSPRYDRFTPWMMSETMTGRDPSCGWSWCTHGRRHPKVFMMFLGVVQGKSTGVSMFDLTGEAEVGFSG
jgi:hypothetical protein